MSENWDKVNEEINNGEESQIIFTGVDQLANCLFIGINSASGLTKVELSGSSTFDSLTVKSKLFAVIDAYLESSESYEDVGKELYSEFLSKKIKNDKSRGLTKPYNCA